MSTILLIILILLLLGAVPAGRRYGYGGGISLLGLVVLLLILGLFFGWF